MSCEVPGKGSSLNRSFSYCLSVFSSIPITAGTPFAGISARSRGCAKEWSFFIKGAYHVTCNADWVFGSPDYRFENLYFADYVVNFLTTAKPDGTQVIPVDVTFRVLSEWVLMSFDKVERDELARRLSAPNLQYASDWGFQSAQDLVFSLGQ